MANNVGTLITAIIRPQSNLDDIAVALNDEIKGGYKIVNTILDRDNILTSRRQIGMHVYVLSNKKTYILIGGINNTYWEEKESSTSNVDFVDGGSF